jgi:hypothetical protein
MGDSTSIKQTGIPQSLKERGTNLRGGEGMGGEENAKGTLSPYRILDLTTERGFICGKILGDLGADVIKMRSCSVDSYHIWVLQNTILRRF